MPGIDYSKWDKICDSDDSGSGDSATPGKPRVTQLEYPSRVTISSSGVHMVNTPSQATVSPFREPLSGSNNKNNNNESRGAPLPAWTSSSSNAVDGGGIIGASSASAHNCDSPARSGGVPCGDKYTPRCNDDSDGESEDHMMYNNLIRNGGREGESHIWSQTRDTVSVSFILPNMNTKAKDIQNFSLEEEEQPNHTSSCVISFSVKGDGGRRRYVLRYPVKVDEDTVEGCWSLHSLPAYPLRLLVVQLVKESMALGMTLWWDRCFIADQTIIDTTKISERNGADATRAEAFRQSWEKAHEEFKRRMIEQREKRCVIDEECDSDVEDDNGGDGEVRGGST
ncbi:hypothetical protein, conserved [Trypanosoma brucei gambiense DAL972]|uniref:CS domain-containing protein n=1 Tax=Trypanosoma brucei gambiense (strain MHOM/CI/86/DAL972) TaxID=679716 RepID=C9ZZA2_TRYB9|nr:hypothetical protein, conserved [Trypanosoma brucei gambiense DAL972]CBH14751.1 hypothetical protein, conserved [Trypanosoma brucei gambiense DAL972]|eukprot:XP_011777017.1 hypothetical protein, conserved [Trypanosoma brucei gambiense DAL972]